MSFGGTVAAMIQSLKANARPKHKAYQGWDKHEQHIFTENRKLLFKKGTAEKLEQIKTKNRLEIQKEQNRAMIITMLSIVVFLPLIIFGIFQFFFSAGQKNYQPYQEANHLQFSNKQQVEDILNSGYEWLNKNHYKNARFQFKRVLEIESENRIANYGYTASYVHECKIAHTHCEKAKKLLDEYILKFGGDSSTEYLNTFLVDKQN